MKPTIGWLDARTWTGSVIGRSPRVGGRPHPALLNAKDVAAVLGLAHREEVATYRKRYGDFPQPLIIKGTCVLWLRQDVEKWARS